MPAVRVSVLPAELKDADEVSHASAGVEVHGVRQARHPHGLAGLHVVEPGAVGSGEPWDWPGRLVGGVRAAGHPDVGRVPPDRALTQGRVLQLETGFEGTVLNGEKMSISMSNTTAVVNFFRTR